MVTSPWWYFSVIIALGASQFYHASFCRQSDLKQGVSGTKQQPQASPPRALKMRLGLIFGASSKAEWGNNPCALWWSKDTSIMTAIQLIPTMSVTLDGLLHWVWAAARQGHLGLWKLLTMKSRKAGSLSKSDRSNLALHLLSRWPHMPDILLSARGACHHASHRRHMLHVRPKLPHATAVAGRDRKRFEFRLVWQ